MYRMIEKNVYIKIYKLKNAVNFIIEQIIQTKPTKIS